MSRYHELAAEIARLIPELNQDGLLNNTLTIEGIINRSINSHAVCIYCGTVHLYGTPDEQNKLTDHIMSCEKNPMVKLVADCKALCEQFDKETASFEKLIHHIYIHDNYADCGFLQMTTEQKKLFCAVLDNCGMTECVVRLREFIAEEPPLDAPEILHCEQCRKPYQSAGNDPKICPRCIHSEDSEKN